LNLMVQHGYITEAKAEETKKIPVSHMLKTNPVTSDRTYAAYADRVKKEIKEKTKYDPEETVMQITTFFDKDMQDYLNKIAQGKNYKYTDADIQVGSTVQEARTGRILGILAAKDYQQGFTNYAYTEKHQPGSSIKPILDYALAIDKLYWCDKHYLSDSPLKVGNWEPKNYDDENHGVVSMSEALGHSYNLPAIRALQAVLEEMSKTEVKAYLSRAGYDMEKEHFTLPFAIGAWTYGVTPEQQAGAYAAISNNGTYIEPHCVDKITLLNGDVISLDEQAQKESIQLFSTATAYILRKVMTGIVKNGEYKNYRGVNIGDSIGAKTGTTNHDGSIAGIKAGRDKDHWYCCFSPDYAWASWCGYPGFIQTKKKKYLKKNQNDAKSISTMIAKYLHKRKMKYSYEKPDTVVTKTIVKYVYPYRLPGNFSVSTVTGVFAKGHAPSTKITRSEYDKKKLKGFSVSISASGVTYHFSDYGKKAKYHVYVSGVKSYSGKSRSGKISFNAKRAKFYSVTGYVEYDDTFTNEKTVHVRWGYVKPKPKPSPTSSAAPSPTPDSSKSTPSSKSSASKSSKKKSSKKKSSKKKSSKKKSSKKKKKKNH
ncbi:MAG: penicillin-binding transpeptidase domain-containing protein, partial [bacterium]